MSPCRTAVVIASVGRPEALAAALRWLTRQTVPPSEIVLAVTSPDDLPASCQAGLIPVRVVSSPKGLPRQRNAGLDAVQGRCDFVFFIDDDFLPSADAILGIEKAFAAFPEASGITGCLLADGIHGPGISFAEAERLLVRHELVAKRDAVPKAVNRRLVGLYGCNMAFRADRIGSLRFDERLPLYGWQEDVDFASRVPGEKIRTDALVGVHCGIKSGREVSGHRLGYSQIANVAYLIRKGSLPLGFGLRLAVRNLLSNHLKAPWPEPWIDRRGRAAGNRLAIADILRGRAAPERILDLATPGRTRTR